MPHMSKRQSHSLKAVKQRWLGETSASSDDSSLSVNISDEDELTKNYLKFKDKIQICDVADVFEFCKNQCNDIGGLTGEVAHKWSNVFMDGKFDEFVGDGRGGKQGDSFYDVYPELEQEAGMFGVHECEKKAPSFTAYDLAQFIDKRFYEINNITKTDFDLVRSVQSCRLDLRRWGARFESNTNRPFFEGHERPDVSTHRYQFIHHFLNNKDNYYHVSSSENPCWNTPKTPVPTQVEKSNDKILQESYV